MHFKLRTAESLATEEEKHSLQLKLESLPSHFHYKIEADPVRMKHVYNEIVFKMDTFPEAFSEYIYNLIGFIEQKSGNDLVAWTCFESAYNVASDVNIISLVDMGYLKLRTNDFEAVRKLISTITKMRITPELESKVHTEIGMLHQWFGLNCAALHYYLDALELNPGNPIAMYGKATALYEMAKHEHRYCSFKYLTEALALLKSALAKLPGFTMIMVYEGKIRNLIVSISVTQTTESGGHSNNEADSIFTQVMKMDCTPEILCLIGEEYLRLGILEGEQSAITIFETALRKRPNSKIYHLLGRAMRAKYFRQNPEVLATEAASTNGTNQGGAGRGGGGAEKNEGNVGGGGKKGKKQIRRKESHVVDEAGVEEVDFGDEGEDGAVLLDDIIEVLTKAVVMCGGTNREAVLDLAETLWIAGQRSRAMTNFELAARSDNVIIQVRAHIRLTQAFIDRSDLTNAETHMSALLKLDVMKEHPETRAPILSLLLNLTRAIIQSRDVVKAREWMAVNKELESEHLPILYLHMVYTKFQNLHLIYPRPAHVALSKVTI